MTDSAPAAAQPVYGRTHCGRPVAYMPRLDGDPIPEPCGKPMPCPDHGWGLKEPGDDVD